MGISIGVILLCLSPTLATGSNVDCSGESADSCKDETVLLQGQVGVASEGEEFGAEENTAEAKEDEDAEKEKSDSITEEKSESDEGIEEDGKVEEDSEGQD